MLDLANFPLAEILVLLTFFIFVYELVADEADSLGSGICLALITLVGAAWILARLVGSLLRKF